MERKLLNALYVNDEDLDCSYKSEKTNLSDIKIGSLGFIADLSRFDIIIYNGRLGKKIL